MFTFLKRPLYVLSNKMRRQSPPETAASERWTADFSSAAKSVFIITSEIAYDANLANKALALGLKKNNCAAWVETGERYYGDQVIEARFRLDGMGGYAAAGVMFRIMERNTYYVALVSTKGYFRVDAVKDGVPAPLAGWTEAPGLSEAGTNLTIIAHGDTMAFLVNGRWIAEVTDPSIPGGHVGFALVSYEPDDDAAHGAADNAAAADSSAVADDPAACPPEDTINKNYTCRAWLESFTLDSRAGVVKDFCTKWADSPAISAESRLRLAETFAALGKDADALAQIRKAWKRREEAAHSVTATYTEMRDRRELLLAARVAVRLGLFDDAEEFVNACLALDSARPAERFAGAEDTAAGAFPGEEAFAEKAKLLSMAGKYAELAEFLPRYIARKKTDAALHALLGHAHWNLNDYESAAAAWCAASNLDRDNGLYAANAANACERVGNTGKALRLRLEGGRIFLRQDNTGELGALIPKLLAAGGDNWEARALTGKWAFAAADYPRAEAELALADDLRHNVRPLPPPDPAVSYLRGVLLIRQDKPRQAIRFFEEAARHAPDYGLFRFKLAEARCLAGANPHDKTLAADIQAARTLLPDNAELKEFAEKIERAKKEIAPPAAAEKAAVKKSIPAKKSAAAETAKPPAAAKKAAVAKTAAKAPPAALAEKPKSAAETSATTKKALPAAAAKKIKTTAKTAAVEKDSKQATVKQTKTGAGKLAAKKPALAKKNTAAKTPAAKKKAAATKAATKTPPAAAAKKPKAVAKAAAAVQPLAKKTKATAIKPRATVKPAAKKPATAKKSAAAKTSKTRSTAKKAQPPAAVQKAVTAPAAAKAPPAAAAKKTKAAEKTAAPAAAKKPGAQAKKPAAPKKPR